MKRSRLDISQALDEQERKRQINAEALAVEKKRNGDFLSCPNCFRPVVARKGGAAVWWACQKVIRV